MNEIYLIEANKDLLQNNNFNIELLKKIIDNKKISKTVKEYMLKDLKNIIDILKYQNFNIEEKLKNNKLYNLYLKKDYLQKEKDMKKVYIEEEIIENSL